MNTNGLANMALAFFPGWAPVLSNGDVGGDRETVEYHLLRVKNYRICKITFLKGTPY